MFHIHCYDANGNESLDPEDVSSLMIAIRGISPEIRSGISSGDWIEPDLEKRLKHIREWNITPDFVSVNMIEENAVEVARTLREKDILFEAGLNERKAAEIFTNSSLREGCCRILIEPEEEELSEALKTIDEIEKVLDFHQIRIRRLLHGFNAVAWDLLKEAKKRGYDCRIGLEDTLYLENGRKVTSNLELAEEALRFLKLI